jgi:hypothetical protein
MRAREGIMAARLQIYHGDYHGDTTLADWFSSKITIETLGSLTLTTKPAFLGMV